MTPYSQKENEISEKIDQTIIEMVKATILEREIKDTLWLEVVLAIIHVKNLWPTHALIGSISPIKKQDNILLNLQDLRVLCSTIYIFLHKKESILKSVKWDARALKRKLVRFNGHTIYKVHINEQIKVIRVKDLQIFKNTIIKVYSSLSDFE